MDALRIGESHMPFMALEIDMLPVGTREELVALMLPHPNQVPLVIGEQGGVVVVSHGKRLGEEDRRLSNYKKLLV